MHPPSQKPHTFSNVTPIQPGMITMVDLGDTSHTLGLFVPQQQQLSIDQPHLLFTHNPVPVPTIDLRKISQFRK